ncbi:MAG: hypothetical protein IJ678_00125 [Kiritimatiellae bacterium]|nr:hypothetical protein [Kiritimatiellia bacterium]
MKIRSALAALPVLCFALQREAIAAVPLEWTADVDRPAPATLAVMRGETVRLCAALARHGAPWNPAATSATLYWQTNGMDSAWWSAPAAVSSNVVSAVFTPEMDPGAPLVSAFLAARDADGALYRASANLRFIHAPGATPNEIPLPARSIDFATVAVTNAPWLLSYEETDPTVPAWAKNPTPPITAETDPRFAEWAATNRLSAAIASFGDLADSAARDATSALAGLNVLDAYVGRVADSASEIGPAATNYAAAAAVSAATAATNALEAAMHAGLAEYIALTNTARAATYEGFTSDTNLYNGKLALFLFRSQPSAAVSIILHFPDGSSSAAAKLYRIGTTQYSSDIAAGSVVAAVYVSGTWRCCDYNTNSDTYDRHRVSTYIRAAAAITRNAICGGTTNGYVKIAPGVEIDATMPILYLDRTTTLNAGATETRFFTAFPGINVQYTVAGFAPRVRAPLYLRGELAPDGRTFTVGDPALSYDPEPPCFPLGIYHASADNSFCFLSQPLLRDDADRAYVTNYYSLSSLGRIYATSNGYLYVESRDSVTSSWQTAWSSYAMQTNAAAVAARQDAVERTVRGAVSAWADYDARGNANPDGDVIMLNRAYTAIGSGFFWASSGGHWCLCSEGTVAYLADTGGSFRIFGSSISNYVGLVAGDSVTVGAKASGFAVDGTGSDAVAHITYPWSGGDHPAVQGAATLEGPWTEMTGGVWVDDPAAGTATVSFPATSDAFFYKATTTMQLSEYFHATVPAYLEGGVKTSAGDLSPVVYDSTVEITAGGHTYRIPAELVR